MGVELGVRVSVGENVKVLVGVDVREGVEVNVRVGVGVRVLVDVREGIKVGVSLVVGVYEGVEVNVFVGVALTVAKNDDMNGPVNDKPTVMNSEIIRAKPPMNQRPPDLPDLSGAMCPSCSKTK